MPGSVQLAAPTAVFPALTYRSFSRWQDWHSRQNRYRDGETQRVATTATSRKGWDLSAVVDSDAALALRVFFQQRRGQLEPFRFYDPFDTVPKFSHDPTGNTLQGRYTVRFANDTWQESAVLGGRVEVSFSLIEIA